MTLTYFPPIARIATCVAGLVLFAASPAVAQDDAGYFSGVRLNPATSGESTAWSFAPPGLKLGQALEYTRASDRASTAFSGYQFSGGFAVGAAVNADRPSSPQGSGVGLKFDGLRWGETRPAVVVDVVSAFNWRNSLSVFGKVGVGRTDGRATPEWASPSASALDRTAISYGVGVRYDFTSSLGLKLELTRGTRFGVDRLRTDVDPDAVNFGIRWTF